MSAVAPETAELSKEQNAALDALKASLKTGYRKAQKMMASVAVAIVDLRMTFTKDGKPDYHGDSSEYRAAVGQIYEEMIADEAERSSFKQAIRYWISKEFMARVQDGKLDANELSQSGIERPARRQRAAAARKPATQPQENEPQESGNGVVHLDNGVAKVEGRELKPKEMRKLVESITTEHLTDIGPVTLLRSVTSELKALLEAIDDPKASVSSKSSVFRGAVKNLLVVSHSLAEKTGVEIPGVAAAGGAVAESETPQKDEGDRLSRRRTTGRPPGRPKGSRNKKKEGETPAEAPKEVPAGINWPS